MATGVVGLSIARCTVLRFEKTVTIAVPIAMSPAISDTKVFMLFNKSIAASPRFNDFIYSINAQYCHLFSISFISFSYLFLSSKLHNRMCNILETAFRGRWLDFQK